MNVLVWFKRDLRLADHPALTLAAGLGRVLPLYIIEPGLWAQPEASGRQWDFTAETLRGLAGDLAALGVPLVIRHGEAPEVIARLCRAHRIEAIVSHQETTGAWSFARDRAVAGWARAQGIDWREVQGAGVQRRHPGRDGWAARRDAFLAQGPLPVPQLAPVEGLAETAASGVVLPARALGLAPDPCPHRQHGGRGQALALVEGFAAHRAAGYRKSISSPLSAERGCSRLSVHLALGVVSAREVQAMPASVPRGDWAAFGARLAWRDHFMQKLEDAPNMETVALHRAWRSVEGDIRHLTAFAAGETGLPYVDACLRYLRATGWLNFRARAMLVSVAVHHLGLDWRAVGQVLGRMFTDYEAGIHWPQVQMQASVTGINAPRLYNPVKQGHDHDPTGSFTRRWVPELVSVPAHWLQEPWKWPGAASLLGRRYPEPLADPGTALRAARARLSEIRNRPDFHDGKRAVLLRHGSRKGRVMVVEPVFAASGQLAFDI